MNNRRRYLITSEHASWPRGGSPRYREPQSKSVKLSRHEVRRRKRGPAKTLDLAQLETLLAYISKTSNAIESDRLKILLSYYAGLRACEIAGLRMEDVTDAQGLVATQILVRGDIAKGGKARTIPMHPEVKFAIKAFQSAFPGIEQFAISRRYSKIRIQSVNALTVWFHWIYKQAGLRGCSSHSGRRTFLTGLARAANRYGKSLRDVQLLAGHARLDTTERYIEPSDDLSDLINSLGKEPRKRCRRGRGA